MVVDIEDRQPVESVETGPGEFGTLHRDDEIKAIRKIRRQEVGHHHRLDAGQLGQTDRRRVAVDDHRLDPECLGELGEGEFGADGISVRSDVA